MRLFILVVPLSLIAPSPGFADECDSLATKIISQTGAGFVRKSEQFGNVFLSHPSASRGFSIICMGGKPKGLDIEYEGEATPRFFGLAAASVAAFLGSKDSTFIRTAGNCLLAAKQDPTGISSQQTAKLSIDCTVDESGSNGGLSIESR